MADIHVFDPPAVLELRAGVVKNVVYGPDGLGVGHGAVFAELDPPDQLRPGIVCPDLGHLLTAEAAVVQDEGGAVRHDPESGAEGGDIRLRQAQVFECYLGVVGGDGLIKKGEGIVEAGLGRGIHQGLNVGETQGAGPGGGHQLYIGQLRHPAQGLGGGEDLGGGQGGEVYGGGIRRVFLPGQSQGIGDLQVRIFRHQGVQLLGGEGGFRQLQPLGILQILQIGQQRLKVRILGIQDDLLNAVGHLHRTQGHGIGHGDLRVISGIDLQGRVAGAAGGIQGF